MNKLTLYFKPTCPFCQKVLDFMQDKEILVPMKDIDEDQKNREELISVGGKGQVPCLVIDGKAMYESDDIIRWMESNLVKQ